MRKWYRYIEGQGLVEIGARQEAGPQVYVQQDSMDPQINHADGRVYDSKTAFRQAAKAAGCEVVGPGDIKSHKWDGGYKPDPKRWESAVVEAMHKLGGF